MTPLKRPAPAATRVLSGVAAVGLVLTVVGCGSDKDSSAPATSAGSGGTTAPTTPGPTTPGATTAPTAAPTTTAFGVPGGTFRFAWATGPDVDDMVNIQPNYRCSSACVSMFHTIFDSLVEADPETKKIYGVLAEKWESNADKSVYTFTLRKDAKFHDGTPVTAEDVRFSWDRTCTAEELKPQSAYACGLLKDVDKMEVVDPQTFRVTLKGTTPEFLLDTASSAAYLGVVPKAAVLKVGQKEFGEKPIGSGPFKFVEWVKGDHVTVERNPDYKWGPGFTKTAGGPALLDKIVFSYIPDAQTRSNALRTGQVDGIDKPSPSDQLDFEKDSKFRVTTAKYNGAPGYLYLNTQSTGPTSDVNVRRAISAAIDRDALNKSVFSGLGVPTTAFVSEGLPYDDPVGVAPAYNLAEAKKHLAAAGYTIGSDGWATKNGQRLKLRATTVPANIKVFEFVQAQLKLAGMDVEVTPRSSAELYAIKNNGTNSGANSPYEIWNATALGFGSRSIGVLNSLFSTSQLPPGWNPNWFTNATFDKAFETAETSADDAVRKAKYKEALAVLADQVPAVPIIRMDTSIVTTTKFAGILPDAAGAYRRFWDVHMIP